ncbi:hypothetical protein P261_00315 [Lachnospiraceae bacterium TWA4]|nr:hypothetical protein P261_00315 [Lachnospiraceae bacterium TWA4]
MVNVNFQIKINEYIAMSESVVEVYLNNLLIISLDGQTRSYSNNFTLPNYKNSLLIKRKYVAEQRVEKVNIFEKFITLLFVFLFKSWSTEPFRCLCECEEEFDVIFNENYADMKIDCLQGEDDIYPRFLINCKECIVGSSKRLFVSDEELKDTYNRHKVLTQFLMFLLTFIFLIAMFNFIKNRDTIAIIVSILLFIALFALSLYGLRILKKKCLDFKLKFDNSSV